MHREESGEKLEIDNLNELERSVSLCTLCVLETGGDSKNESPRYVSAFDKIVTSNFFAQSSMTNYLSNYFDLTRIDDQNEEPTFFNDNQFSSADVIITQSIFDNDEEISQSLFNVLTTLDASNVTSTRNNDPETSKNVDNLLQRKKHDPSPISAELRIVSQLSKSAIQQILNDENNLLDEQENIEAASRSCEKAEEASEKLRFKKLNCNETKVDDFKLIAENNDKAWEKNASLEPLRCYVSDITDDVIPRKKPKIVSEKILHSPYKIKFQDCLTVPRKCTKSVKSTLDCPIVPKRSKFDYENDIDLKNETTKNKRSKSNDKNEDHRKPERLELLVRNEKIKERNILKKEKFITSMGSRNPPQYPHLHSRTDRTGSRRPPTLKRLQEKIAQSCKILIEGVEDLRNLSLLIDELRDGFSQTLIQAPEKKTKGSKQEFISTCTRTSNHNGVPKNSSNSEIQGNVVESPPMALKPSENEPETFQDCQDSIMESFDLPPRDGVTRANVEINRESHLRSSTPREVFLDNYYNPLRPRRWPNNQYNNRQHARKNRTRHSPHKFPPLLVNRETEKTAKN